MGHYLCGASARCKLYLEKKKMSLPAVVDVYVSRLPGSLPVDATTQRRLNQCAGENGGGC